MPIVGVLVPPFSGEGEAVSHPAVVPHLLELFVDPRLQLGVHVLLLVLAAARRVLAER